MAESSGVQTEAQSSGNIDSAAANQEDKDAATFSEAVRAAQARYIATSPKRDWVDNVFDVIDIVGGTAEALAGAAIASGGAAATVGTGGGGAFLGVPLTIGGAAVAAHGLDTAETAFGRLITGFDLDTSTSEALQAAGMSRDAANLTDAGIGLGFSLGTSAIAKSPILARVLNSFDDAALAAAGQTRKAAKEVLEREASSYIGVAMKRDGGHLQVGIQRAESSPMEWTDLVIGRGTRNVLLRATDEPDADYITVLLPIAADKAAGASEYIANALKSQTLRGMTDYRYAESDCLVYAEDILKAAGIETSTPSDEALAFLRQLEAEAFPLRNQAEELRALARQSSDPLEQIQHGLNAQIKENEAISIEAEYVIQRTSEIMDNVLVQSEQLINAKAVYVDAFGDAASAYDKMKALADAARVANNGSVDRTGRQAAVAGGAYLLDTFQELFPEGNAQATGLPGQSSASDRSTAPVDRDGADDQTGLTGQDYFDLFGSPLDAMEYDSPVAPDGPADPVRNAPASPSEPQDTGATPTGWPVGLAEPAGTAQEPVAPSSPSPETPETAAPTQPAPDAGRPAAPAPGPQQPTGGDTVDEGEPFFGDIIKMSEDEMREWTPADGGPRTDDPDDEDADAGGAEPAAGSGGSEMPNPEGDAAPGTEPSYPVYRANGVGAIRPAEEPADLGGGFINIGSVYNRTNGPGTIRPTDGGPVYDIDVNVSSLDLNAIYGRSNGADAIRPNEFADPLPSGGTLPVGLGGDPTIMAEGFGLGRFGLGS